MGDNENVCQIQNADELEQLIETPSDKLVAVTFIKKGAPDYRKTIASIEKCAYNHGTSMFAIVDIDKITRCKYTLNIVKIPQIDCYYKSQLMLTMHPINEKEIALLISDCERQIMSGGNKVISQPVQMFNQPNIKQIEQNILNDLRQTNPQIYQYMIQNPAELTRRAMNLMQSNRMMHQQSQYFNPVTQPSHIQPIVPPQNIQSVAQPPSTFQIENMGTMYSRQHAQNNVPMFTIDQLKEMIKVFREMQELGLLNMIMGENTVPKPKPEPTNAKPILLPSGDKIVPLADGTYGIIKNKVFN